MLFILFLQFYFLACTHTTRPAGHGAGCSGGLGIALLPLACSDRRKSVWHIRPLLALSGQREIHPGECLRGMHLRGVCVCHLFPLITLHRCAARLATLSPLSCLSTPGSGNGLSQIFPMCPLTYLSDRLQHHFNHCMQRVRLHLCRLAASGRQTASDTGRVQQSGSLQHRHRSVGEDVVRK